MTTPRTLSRFATRPLSYDIDGDVLDAIGTAIAARKEFNAASHSHDWVLMNGAEILFREASTALMELEEWARHLAETFRENPPSIRDHDLENRHREVGE
jgi:hypothetical protein